MAKTGMKQNTKPNLKAYEEARELEFLIEEMGNAMRDAYLPYIAKSGRGTPHMDAIWNTFVDFARRASK